MALIHVTLATRDVERTRVFFAETFRWRTIERPTNIEAPAAWLEIGPGQEMHLIEVADFEASRFEREYGRHVALSHPRSDFTALKERLVRNGATVLAPERATPFERFFFRDPNGYVFEVIGESR
jgi:catechol 2,3-dioxygenase-like lactoylglutathione lyase family enzyme